MNGISQIPINNPRYGCGIGYVIIPSDGDRSLYVAKCMRTCTIAIMTEDNEVVWNVMCDVSDIQRIDFPQTSNELGSCVCFVNHENHNKPIVVAVLTKNDEHLMLNEHQFEISKVDENCCVTISGNRKQHLLTINVSSNESSKMIVNISDDSRKSQLKLAVTGLFESFSDQLSINCRQNVQIIVGTKKNHFKVAIVDDSIEFYVENQKLLFSVSKDGKIVLNGSNVTLGDGDLQPTLLSNNLLEQLNKNKIRLDTLLSAIKSAPVIPTDGGASFKAFLVAAISSLQAESYLDVVSKTVKNS